jgi:hypothetical protein
MQRLVFTYLFKALVFGQRFVGRRGGDVPAALPLLSRRLGGVIFQEVGR